MENESILQIVLKARDEASKTIEEMGKKIEETSKNAVNMGAAFKMAGGLITGVGIAGVAIMKDWIDKGMEAQATTIKTNTLLAAEAESVSTASVAIYEHTAGVKEQTKAIQEQISAKQLQIEKLRLSTGDHKEEIKTIQQSILVLKEQSLNIKESGAQHGALIGYTKGSKVAIDDLTRAAEAAGEKYLELGFNAEQSSLAFARLLGPTKDIKVANEALATAADLARFRNLSLDEATTLVTRAYEGNTRALKALGIEVPKGAKGLEVLSALHERLQGQAENFANSYEGAMARFGASSEHLKERLGAALLPTLDSLFNKLDQFINWINKLNPSIIQTIAKVTLFSTAFALIVGPILLVIGFIPTIIAGFAFLASVALPLTLILGAVGLAAYVIYKNWGQVTAAFQGAIPAVQGIITNLSQFWSSIQPQLQLVIKDITDFINKTTQHISDWIKKNRATFEAFWEVVKGIFTFALGFLLGFWQTTWQSIADLLQSVWNVMVSIIQVAWGIIQVFIGGALGIFTGDWNKAWDLVKQGLSNVWEGIKGVVTNGVNFLINTIKAALNTVIGFINGVIEGFNAVSAKVPGPHLTLPTIPKFEQGGYVPRTGLAFLHEGEFVLSKDMIAGRQASPAYAKTTYNQPININAKIDGNIDLNQLGYRIAFALRNTR